MSQTSDAPRGLGEWFLHPHSAPCRNGSAAPVLEAGGQRIALRSTGDLLEHLLETLDQLTEETAARFDALDSRRTQNRD